MPEPYLPPWLRDKPDLIQVFLNDPELGWFTTGDASMAVEAVRQAPGYESYFPGNLRPDGSVIHSEPVYQSVVESYEDVLLSINVNPDLFGDKFGAMVAGYVSPEEFAGRVERKYEGIINQIDEVRQWYVDRGFAENVSREAIIAAELDPDIGSQILAGDIAMAQVGGQASRRGFDFGVGFARQLTQAGLDTSSEASSFFALAQGTIPVIQTLARRHADPDDDFDLEEFTQAQLFEDPDQRRRMRRLVAQERASFTSGIAGVGSVARSDLGATGVEAF